MIKKLLSYVLVFTLGSLLFAQSSIRMGLLKGLSSLPAAYLIENKAKLSVQNMTFTIFDSEERELTKLLQGEIDIAFLAPENAAKVFTAGKGKIVCLGLVQNSCLTLVTNDQTCSEAEQLKGKNIFTSPSSDIIIEYILSKKGLSKGQGEDSFNLDHSLSPAELPNALILGKVEYALISEPYASVAIKNSSSLKRSLSFQKIYSQSEEGASLPAMLLVASSSLASEKRDLIRRFTELYKNAVNWTKSNPSNAAFYAEEHRFGLSPIIAKMAIPQAGFIWRDSTAARSDLEKYLTILGRELPGDDFYFKK